MDYGVNPDAWEAVVDGLNAEGLPARLEEPVEQRGAQEVVVAVGVFLAEYSGEEVLNTIRRVLSEKLRGKPRLGTMKGEPRRVPIYGPNGDVLTWVEVPSTEDGDG